MSGNILIFGILKDTKTVLTFPDKWLLHDPRGQYSSTTSIPQKTAIVEVLRLNQVIFLPSKLVVTVGVVVVNEMVKLDL